MAYSMTAVQAAARLGVKQATLYAYVSRGVLGRGKTGDGRGSLFDPDEAERLALRGRPRPPPGALGPPVPAAPPPRPAPRRPAGAMDLTVESAITEIPADTLRFRGLDATRLAVTRTFEDVAELLWTGDFPPTQAVPPAQLVPSAQPVPSTQATWQATPAALAAGRAAQAA